MRATFGVFLWITAFVINGCIIGGAAGDRVFWILYSQGDGSHGVSMVLLLFLMLGAACGMALGSIFAILLVSATFPTRGLLFGALTGQGPSPLPQRRMLRGTIFVGSLILPILVFRWFF